jgi:hypothetical protein
MNQLLSDGFNIDLSEDIAIPMNFAIANVRDPSKRQRNFSKTVQLPDTTNNRNFFSGAFSLHVTDDTINFDATAKIEAQLLKNGVPILTKGLIKLNNVTRNHNDLQFEITLFSETIDAFLLLSQINVNELDWSDYTHTLTQANVAASWSAAAGTGYYYPLIERGNGRVGTIWRLIDMIPYVYMHEVLIKILKYAGITYSSNFIDSARFKNILFGYGGGEINAVNPLELANRKIDYRNGNLAFSESVLATGPGLMNTEVSSTFTPVTITNAVFTNLAEFFDEYGQYQDGKITVQKTGNYNLNLRFPLAWLYTIGNNMQFESARAPIFDVLRNGSIIGQPPRPEESSIGGAHIYVLNQNFLFSSGDVIEFRVSPSRCYAEKSLIVTATNIDFGLGTGDGSGGDAGGCSIDMNCIDTTLFDGATVEISRFLPTMKCSDFLMGVIRQFNLYQADEDLYGVSKIEPLETFYTATNVFDDISKKIDYSKPFKISPSANDYAKNIRFMFKENKDFDAGVYRERFDSEYGDYNYIQGSYYAKGELKIEVPWSTIVPYAVSPKVLVPRFITIDENGAVKPQKGNPRIMFRNGLKTGGWLLRKSVAPFDDIIYTTYPSVHHFDNWNDPTFDLNFQLVNEVYYLATIVTTANCYTEYYSTFINEVTSSAGKFINCYVKFKAQDVQNRNFGKLIMINGSLFRLNIIKDFDSDVSESTNIELVKVLKAKKRSTKKLTTETPVNPPVQWDDILSPEGVGGDTGVIIGGGNTRNTIKLNG